MINIDIKDSINANGDNALFVKFNYDEHILGIIKSFPTRYYISSDKVWELPLNQLGKLVEKLSDYDIEITGKYICLDEGPKIKIPKSFKFKTEPFNHQIEGVTYGLNHDKWLLGDEQGLGKTKQVIDIAEVKKVKHCLIICCVNGLKWNWRDEVHTHSNSNAFILGQRRTSTGITIGSNADRLDDLNYLDELPRYIITNIETLRYKVKTGNKIKKRVKGKEVWVDEYFYPITDKLVKLCTSGEIEMIAVDEFHKCKNPEAEQAEQILRLHTPIQIAMTGTPLMNAPLDLFMPLSWLGYEKHSFWQFKNHHCHLGGFGGKQVVGYKHLEEIDETLSTMMLRRLKDDVLDLPEKTYINEYVEMGKEQAKLYATIHADLANNVSNIKMTNNPLVEFIRLRQATGHPNILASDINESAKFDRMEEIVEDAVENGRKVVVFSNWTEITDRALMRLKRFNPATITGKIKDKELLPQKEKFQEDARCKVIVGTIGKMGTGYTLTAGTVVIFLDEPWNKALKDQAVDRCHRIGTSSNITIYTLLCKNTIDERINDLVEKKGAMSDILVDGKIEGDKNALINFLLS